MKRFTYKNKKTGQLVYSDTKLNDPLLVLITAVRDTKMKATDNIRQK